jgi:hypothetical protein
VLGGLGTLFLYSKLPGWDKTVINLFSLLGTYLSVFGLIVAYLQIRSIKAVAESTNRAVLDTTKKITQLLSVADLAKAIKIVHEVQNYLMQKKLEPALIRLRDLKATLIQMKYNSDLDSLTNLEDYQSMINDVSIDLGNLHNDITAVKAGIDISKVNSNLERVETTLTIFENKLKYQH